MEPSSEQIQVERITSAQPGRKFLLFGAVHGNEPCGPLAIERVLERIRSGEVALLGGELIAVPVANPGAYAEDARFLEDNLNRVFRKTELPETYEARLANVLAPFIEETDIFLDIHSTSAPGPTCVFIDYPTPENIAFAGALGMDYAITGWSTVYANNPAGLDSYDTTRYTYEQGKTGVIIECGQHAEPTAAAIAERSILRALAHFGMIDPLGTDTPRTKTRTVRMHTLQYKHAPGDVFSSRFEHLEPLVEGAVIATRESGEPLVAPRDAVMVMPKHTAQPGGEWFYLGTEEDPI